MKHIRHELYRTIRAALTKHLIRHSDPCGYLFFIINGRMFKSPGRLGETKLILPMARIRDLWNSKHVLRLVDLAILCHYRGHIVETAPQASMLVLPDDIVLAARKLTDLIKQEKKTC